MAMLVGLKMAENMGTYLVSLWMEPDVKVYDMTHNLMFRLRVVDSRFAPRKCH